MSAISSGHLICKVVKWGSRKGDWLMVAQLVIDRNKKQELQIQGMVVFFLFLFSFCLNSSDKLSKHSSTPHSNRTSFLGPESPAPPHHCAQPFPFVSARPSARRSHPSFPVLIPPNFSMTPSPRTLLLLSWFLSYSLAIHRVWVFSHILSCSFSVSWVSSSLAS